MVPGCALDHLVTLEYGIHQMWQTACSIQQHWRFVPYLMLVALFYWSHADSKLFGVIISLACYILACYLI